MSDNFSVGRMIDGFHTADLCLKLLVVVLQVLEKFKLRRRGPNNEDGIDAVERPRELVKEPGGVIGMFFRLSAPFGMPMDEVLRREDRCFVDWFWLHMAGRLRLNAENASLFMIDPHHDVRRHSLIFHEVLGRSCAGRRAKDLNPASSRMQSTVICWILGRVAAYGPAPTVVAPHKEALSFDADNEEIKAPPNRSEEGG